MCDVDNPPEAVFCAMCATDRPAAAAADGAAGADRSAGSDGWICNMCTSTNGAQQAVCELCGSPAPPRAAIVHPGPQRARSLLESTSPGGGAGAPFQFREWRDSMVHAGAELLRLLAHLARRHLSQFTGQAMRSVSVPHLVDAHCAAPNQLRAIMEMGVEVLCAGGRDDGGGPAQDPLATDRRTWDAVITHCANIVTDTAPLAVVVNPGAVGEWQSALEEVACSLSSVEPCWDAVVAALVALLKLRKPGECIATIRRCMGQPQLCGALLTPFVNSVSASRGNVGAHQVDDFMALITQCLAADEPGLVQAGARGMAAFLDPHATAPPSPAVIQQLLQGYVAPKLVPLCVTAMSASPPDLDSCRAGMLLLARLACADAVQGDRHGVRQLPELVAAMLTLFAPAVAEASVLLLSALLFGNVLPYGDGTTAPGQSQQPQQQPGQARQSGDRDAWWSAGGGARGSGHGAGGAGAGAGTTPPVAAPALGGAGAAASGAVQPVGGDGFEWVTPASAGAPLRLTNLGLVRDREVFSALMALMLDDTASRLPRHTVAMALRLVRAMLGHFSLPNVTPDAPTTPLFTAPHVFGLELMVGHATKEPAARVLLPARSWGKRRHSLGFYQVDPPAGSGAFPFGDVAYLDEEASNVGNGPVLCARQRPTVPGAFQLLAHPTDYTVSGHVDASATTRKATVWTPVAPAGYVALGCVVVAGDAKPALDRIVCVHTSITEESQATQTLCNISGGKLFVGTDITKTFRVQTHGRGLLEPTKVGVGASRNDINQVYAHLFVSLSGTACAGAPPTPRPSLTVFSLCRRAVPASRGCCTGSPLRPRPPCHRAAGFPAGEVQADGAVAPRAHGYCSDHALCYGCLQVRVVPRCEGQQQAGAC